MVAPRRAQWDTPDAFFDTRMAQTTVVTLACARS